MNQDTRYDELMLRWLNRELSEQEFAELKEMPEFGTYQHIVETADNWKKPEWKEEEFYDELIERREQKTAKGKVIFLKPMYIGLAASLLIGLFFFLDKPTDEINSINYTTAFGEQKEVKLPDQSVVKLNALSGIELDTTSWKEKREIALTGEAFFDVVEGPEFKVDFKPGKLYVRGTKFDIQSREGSFVVECYSGRVAVYLKKDSLILTKGQSAQFDGSGNMIPGTFKKDMPAWFGGISTFEAQKLSVVFAELEAQFGVKVITQDIDVSRKFSGRFTHENLEKALKMVCTPMSIKYKIEDKKVFLSGRY